MELPLPAQEFKLISLEALIPTFGFWCGPGWSAGRRDGYVDVTYTEVAMVKDIFGNFQKSTLDTLCRLHDLSYLEASGRPDEVALKVQADAMFLRDLSEAYSSLTPSEKPYASMALVGFFAKMVTANPLAMVANFVKEGVSSVLDTIRENSTPKSPFVELEGENVGRSLVVTEDGLIVAGYSRTGEQLTVSLDPELDVAEFLLQQNADSENSYFEYDSLRIQMNIDSAVNEMIHSTDGVEDFKGVMIGPVTQEKLDQFCALGSIARDVLALPDSQVPDKTEPDSPALEIFDSLDVSLDSYARNDFTSWFDEANPILIEPYQWERVDSSLENFWYYGNDQTLAAYDLGDVIEDANWRPDFWSEDWLQPNLDPWFSGSEQFSDFYFPEPVYYSDPNGISNFGDDYFSDFGTFSYPATPQHDFFFSYIDPLVLKLGGGSVHTTNLSGSKVMFDMDGDGDKDKTGWITADQAFLVRDKNNNGKVDDVSEMFSEQMSATASTGFSALAELDTRRNGRIDKYDKFFGELRLWTDINANGVTDGGELHKLSRFGIKSIDLGHVDIHNHYDNGNMVLSTTSYTAERKGITYIGEVAEVLFNFGDHAPVANVYLSDQATALRTADGKVIEVLNGAGVQKVNASLSGVNVLIGSVGDVLSAGNAGQSLLIGNGGATLNGNGGDVHFIVNGSQNIVNTGTGQSVIDVHGDANTINATRGDVELNVDGSLNKLSIGSGADVELGGAANTLTAGARAKDIDITISGDGQVVHVSNATIDIEAHASLTLNGKNNDIAMAGDAMLSGKASGGTLTVIGDDNVATLSGAFIAVTKGAELTLTGGKQQVVLAGDATLVMLSGAKDSTINVFGQGNQLTANKAIISFFEGAGLELTGSGSKITLTGEATLGATGTGHVIDVYGTGNDVDVDRSKIYEHGLADLELTGAGNTLKVTRDNSPAVVMESLALGHTERLLQQAWDRYEQTIDRVLAADWSAPPNGVELVNLVGVGDAEAIVLPTVIA